MNRLRKNIENNSTYNILKNIKYLEINLVKKVKDLYNENYKSLKKTTEDGKIFHAHGLGEPTL
jgi:hypothetical protein